MLLPVSQVLMWCRSLLAHSLKDGLSCIQSGEKTGAREEMFITLVPTERSSICSVSGLWPCQPLQTHGRAWLPTVCMDSSWACEPWQTPGSDTGSIQGWIYLRITLDLSKDGSISALPWIYLRMDLSQPSIKRLGRLQNETFLTQRSPAFGYPDTIDAF